jgi:hypothetical protein
VTAKVQHITNLLELVGHLCIGLVNCGSSIVTEKTYKSECSRKRKNKKENQNKTHQNLP